VATDAHDVYAASVKQDFEGVSPSCGEIIYWGSDLEHSCSFLVKVQKDSDYVTILSLLSDGPVVYGRPTKNNKVVYGALKEWADIALNEKYTACF